ncbi:hypothetical protein ACLKA7_016534 [Drosophila subpalustris]
MSQGFRVLQCVECSLYQVDIVKKTNRWECKVCRQKQVVHREFFRGSVADCRSKVQQLNLERGQKRQAQEDRKILEVQKEESESSSSAAEAQLQTTQLAKAPSKWSAFVDEPIRQAPKIAYSQKIINQELNLDEPENSSTKRPRVSNKRQAQNTIKKPFSKWQKFL